MYGGREEVELRQQTWLKQGMAGVWFGGDRG